MARGWWVVNLADIDAREVWRPCPICGEDMHPAMERRYGHCGGPYCSGWSDAQADAPDHHAAAFGCVGTGAEAPVDGGRLWWDGTGWNLGDTPCNEPEGCTALEAREGGAG